MLTYAFVIFKCIFMYMLTCASAYARTTMTVRPVCHLCLNSVTYLLTSCAYVVSSYVTVISVMTSFSHV